jgi:uncharacterized membrane protein
VVTTVAQTAATPVAQTPAKPANQTAPPAPPDMVCWGNDPSWSFQFASWGARYVGADQPDQEFLGSFVWAAEDKVWVWQRTNQLLGAVNGLSAVIKKASCKDPSLKGTFPYSAQVNLPEGDAVSGCCRKLRPEEAPIGPHGALPENPPQQ